MCLFFIVPLLAQELTIEKMSENEIKIIFSSEKDDNELKAPIFIDESVLNENNKEPEIKKEIKTQSSNQINVSLIIILLTWSIFPLLLVFAKIKKHHKNKENLELWANNIINNK
jgi:hypothetical protein